MGKFLFLDLTFDAAFTSSNSYVKSDVGSWYFLFIFPHWERDFMLRLFGFEHEKFRARFAQETWYFFMVWEPVPAFRIEMVPGHWWWWKTCWSEAGFCHNRLSCVDNTEQPRQILLMNRGSGANACPPCCQNNSLGDTHVNCRKTPTSGLPLTQ